MLHTLTTKLSAPLSRAHLEPPPDQIMTPNIITEAHSHSFGSRMTVAQRKEAHELRKVRMILGSFEHPGTILTVVLVVSINSHSY